MRSSLPVLIITCVLLFNSSCKKEKELPHNNVLKVRNTIAAIPPHVFNWETADYMPTPPGTTPILVPWASGSNQLFSDEIAFDFKRSDGWNLVYNTFSPTQLTSPNFFALYNKYRGILRFYLYIPPGNPSASSYFSDGLGILGTSSSPIMNFSSEISDLDMPVTSSTRIQNYQVQSTGAWYACQYEIAYDPNIRNVSQQNLNFVWNTSSTNISNVKLNGESNGTLTGTVGAESPGGFNLGNLLGQAAQGVIYATGFKTIGLLKIGNKDIRESMENGAKGGLTGAVKGFLNAILGGSPTSPQMVNLTLKTKIELAGTISNTSGIAMPTLVIPGIKNQGNSVGYIPYYNDALGVLYMKEKPKLYLTEDSTDYGHNFDLKINGKFITTGPLRKHTKRFHNHYNNKEKIIFNPALLNEGVTFKILKEDIVIPCDSVTLVGNASLPKEDPSILSELFAYGYESDTNYSGVHIGMEYIGQQNYAVFGAKDPENSIAAVLTNWRPGLITSGTLTTYSVDNIKSSNASIRYTILVTPPNGGKPMTIVKTFKAEVLKGFK